MTDLYSMASITKAGLSTKLGLHRNTACNWGKYPPQYAIAYLELLAEHNSLKETLRELGR